MPLSAAQLTALKADVQADGALSGQPNNADGNSAIAAAYNATASPDFWVWKSSVTRDELVGSVGPEGTTFAWIGAGYITRTQGERDAFNAIFSVQGGTVNPSMANVRQAFSDIFSGSTAPAPANRTHLLAVARRRASRIEKLFAAGTGSTASPATMAYEGPVTADEIQQARNS